MIRLFGLLALMLFAACGGSAPGDGTGGGSGGGGNNTVIMSQMANAPICIKVSTNTENPDCASDIINATGTWHPTFEYNLWVERCEVEDGKIKLLGAIEGASKTRHDLDALRNTLAVMVQSDQMIAFRGTIAFFDKEGVARQIVGGSECALVTRTGDPRTFTPRLAW